MARPARAPTWTTCAGTSSTSRAAPKRATATDIPVHVFFSIGRPDVETERPEVCAPVVLLSRQVVAADPRHVRDGWQKIEPFGRSDRTWFGHHDQHSDVRRRRAVVPARFIPV